MPALTRYYQKIFGSSAGSAQISKFGSLAAGAPETYSGSTITPAIVQNLGNYLSGWFGAVVGSYSPAIEDMNALFYLVTYQLSYLMQQGAPEWDASTTYYVGSVAKSGKTLFVSLTDNNLNNPLSDASQWVILSSTKEFTSLSASASLTSGSSSIILANASSGGFTITMPQASTCNGATFKIKKTDSSINNVTVDGYASETIDGELTYIIGAKNGAIELISTGTEWYIL